MRKLLAFSLISVSLNSYAVIIEDVTHKYPYEKYGSTQDFNSEFMNTTENSEYIQLQENEKIEVMNSLRYFFSNYEFDKVLNKIMNVYSNDSRKIDLNFIINDKIISNYHKKDLIHYITEFKKNAFDYLQVLEKYQSKFLINYITEDIYGNTPLFNVCKNNDVESAKFLLEYSEVKNKLNNPLNHLKHPLYEAEKFQDRVLAKLLIKNGAVNNYQRYGTSNFKTTKQNIPVDEVKTNSDDDCKKIYQIDSSGQLYFTQDAQEKLFTSAEKGDLTKFKNYLSTFYKAMDLVHTSFKVFQFLPPNLAFNYKNSSTLFHVAFNNNDKSLLKILLSYKGLFNFDFNIKDKNNLSVYEKVNNSNNTLLKNDFMQTFYSNDYNYYNSNASSFNNEIYTNNSSSYGVYSDSNPNPTNTSGYSKKNLENSSFSFKIFYKEKFVKAKLKGTNFKSATLIDTDFTGADLTDVDFTGADLTRANLSGANLSGANFTNAYVNNTDFTKVIISNKTILPASEGILLREKDIVFNDNKVHKFAPASQFFNLSSNINYSFIASQSDFEKDLEKSLSSQKKKREQEYSGNRNAPSTYDTPDLEQLRNNRLKFYNKVKN